MKVMENRTLSLEDIKLLVGKVHAAQQAGNYILFRYANYSIDVLTMQGEISEEKNWDKGFEMPLILMQRNENTLNVSHISKN